MPMGTQGYGDFARYLASVSGASPPSDPALPEELVPELVLGFVRPQGTRNDDVVKRIKTRLEDHNYIWREVKISRILEEMAALVSGAHPEAGEFQAEKGYRRTLQLMRWGDIFRRAMTPYEMARFAVTDIVRSRPSAQADAIKDKKSGVAYLIQNLMHPTEVSLLRSIYRERFFLFATHQPEKSRRENLETEYKKYSGGDAPNEASLVIRIDSGERTAEIEETFPFDFNGSANALNINSTFDRADVFVAHDRYADVVDGWSKQLFSYPFGAPNRDEFGMGLAYSAARLSTALGRSVGAAIVSEEVAGDLSGVLAVGWNDAAEPGGGLGTDSSKIPVQEHLTGEAVDSSDERRVAAVKELLDRLFDPIWVSAYDSRESEGGEVVNEDEGELTQWLNGMRQRAKDLPPISDEMVVAMASLPALSSSRVFGLIEFGRAVHAEMAAITSAARRGTSINGATMFVTTFPCHECARNIVAAGITRVVFVEPYGKSMTNELYSHSIVNAAVDGTKDSGRVRMEPFVGISPSRFDDLFSSVPRKYGLKDARGRKVEPGRIIEWNSHNSTLRGTIRGYLSDPSDEGLATDYFERAQRYAEESVVNGMVKHLKRSFPNIDDSWKWTTAGNRLEY
ncbi:deaminase [Leifsonia sp. 22587]|uniref:deaminase n=1 Tax=Leifsonia sp. 22587 TaxID=3453946 RepID=UPI003F863413